MTRISYARLYLDSQELWKIPNTGTVRWTVSVKMVSVTLLELGIRIKATSRQLLPYHS